MTQKRERIQKPKPRQRREEEPVEDVKAESHDELIERLKALIEDIKKMLEEVDD